MVKELVQLLDSSILAVRRAEQRRAQILVLRDVRDEAVSAKAAARDYGVVISADGRTVNEAATIARRGR